MEQINTYSISRLQKALELSEKDREFFLIDIGKEPLYTDEPFRTVTYTLLLLKKGTISFNAGLVSHTFQAPALIAVAPTVTRSFLRTEEKPEMAAIFFTEAFLLEPFSDIFFLNRFPFFEDNEQHVFALDAEAFTLISGLFDQLSDCLKSARLYRAEIVRHLISILIYRTDALNLERIRFTPAAGAKSSLFQRFRKLVTKEFLRQRSVNYYADALNVTPKHLSQTAKRDSGLTAGEWIDKAVMLEAKVLLQNHMMNIAQISDYLNFSDQSIFGKYFKNLHGSSPLDYRRSLKA